MKKDFFTLLLVITLSFIFEIVFHLYFLKTSHPKISRITSSRVFTVDEASYRIRWFNYGIDKRIQLMSESSKNQFSFYINRSDDDTNYFYDLPIHTNSYMKHIIVWILRAIRLHGSNDNSPKSKTHFFGYYVPTQKVIDALTPKRLNDEFSSHFNLSGFMRAQVVNNNIERGEKHIQRMKQQIENINHFNNFSPALVLHIQAFDESAPLADNLVNIIQLSNFSPNWKELFFVSRMEGKFYLQFSYSPECQHSSSVAKFLNIQKTQTRTIFKATKEHIFNLSQTECNIKDIYIYIDKKDHIYPSAFDSGLIYFE